MHLSADFIIARDSFLLAFPALFSIINPMGAAIIFLQAAQGCSRAEQRRLARQVALYSVFLLIGSVWAGSALLGFFGITINALRVAGGLFVARGGWVMLQSPEDNEQKRQDQITNKDGSTVSSPRLQDIAFFPLTMPFTVGPGTIAVAIALRSGDGGRHWFAYDMGIYSASVAVALTVWIAYSHADKLTSMLGITGTRILGRLAALVLLAIGVQIVASGIIGFAADFMAAHKP